MLLVLDFTSAPGLPEIDSLLQIASNILHQDVRNALLIFFPKKYTGQSTQSLLNQTRRIEDMLMKCQVSLENEIAMHFTVEGMHGADRRNLAARAKLCVSEALTGGDGLSSPWLESVACRGKVSDIPLIRIREMRRLALPGSISDTVEAWQMTPAERIQHKGSRAAAKILESLVDGLTLAPDCRLDVVELQLVNVPDWLEGVWSLKQSWESQGTKPQVAYAGFCRDKQSQRTLQGHLEATLMAEWWPSQTQAGPAEPEEGQVVERPQLQLCSWDGSSPALSEIASSKFDGDETYGGKWHALCAEFRQFVTNSVVPLLNRPGASQAGAGEQQSLDVGGPNLTVPPHATSIETVLLSATAKDDFNMDDVFPELFELVFLRFELFL